jgi:hypothetical protein
LAIASAVASPVSSPEAQAPLKRLRRIADPCDGAPRIFFNKETDQTVYV